MSFTRILQQQFWPSPARNDLFSWVTLMPEWEQTTIHGPPALVLLEYGKWIKMVSDCLSCVPSTPFASLTPSRQNLSTKSPGDTRVQSTDTNWTWFWLGLLPSRTFLYTLFYHSADCDTDHFLVCCMIRLQPKKFYRSKKPREPKHWSQQDVSARPCGAVCRGFCEGVRAITTWRLCYWEVWESLRDKMHRTAPPWLRPWSLATGLTPSRPSWLPSSSLSARPS